MKVATYSRGKQLAIREEPGGEVIGTMGDMEAAQVKSVAGGWVELAAGGYVREDLVSLFELVGEAPVADYEAADAKAVGTEAPAGEPQEPGQDEEGGNGELDGMKLNDLRELARNSGVKLPRNATKAEIIKLLLSNE